MIMHRRARNRTSLCRQHCDIKELTLHDEEVTCEDCIRMLKALQYTSSKTRLINKLTNKGLEQKDDKSGKDNKFDSRITSDFRTPAI